MNDSPLRAALGETTFITPDGPRQVQVLFGYTRECGRSVVGVDLSPSCDSRLDVWLWEVPGPHQAIGCGLADDEVVTLISAAGPGETVEWDGRVLRVLNETDLSEFLSSPVTVLLAPPPRVLRAFGDPIPDWMPDSAHECDTCYWR